MRAYETQKRSKSTRRSVLLLRNKKPAWDPALRANVLDFQGRVTESSVKNFQLVAEEGEGMDEIDAGRVVVQFGKRGGETFSLDFSYPVSPVQAFALALSSLDDKLCYSI